MHRARSARRLPAAVLALVCVGCVSTGPAEPVKAWVTGTFRPAVRELHDARLAPWRAPFEQPPSEAELRAGCEEVLARHTTWEGRISRVPDETLERLVASWVAAERAALADCVRTGSFAAPVPGIGPVTDRLRGMGLIEDG